MRDIVKTVAAFVLYVRRGNSWYGGAMVIQKHRAEELLIFSILRL